MPKLKVPATPEGLAELLGKPDEVGKYFDKAAVMDGTTKEFLDAYSAAWVKKNPDPVDEMRTQVQSVLFDMVRENGGGRPPRGLDLGNAVNFRNGKPEVALNGSAAVSKGKGVIYNKAAPGAQYEQKVKKEEQFDSVAEYCQAIKFLNSSFDNSKQAELIKDKLSAYRKFRDDFGSEDPGSGGFLVPEVMRSQLLQLAIEESFVRPRATVIPMSSLVVPVPSVDDESHQSSLFGGITFGWSEEGAAISTSAAKFGRVTLRAKKLAGAFKVPNELLMDAPAFSAFFDAAIPAGLAWNEDLKFLIGTGVGEPLGMLGAANPAYVANGGAGTSGARSVSPFAWADLTTMYSRMLPQSLRRAVWIANIDTFPALAQLTLSTPGIWMGGYGAPSAADTPPITIMGRPVIFTEKVAAAGTSTDINFVDPNYYLIGDRQSVAVSSSEHEFFLNDLLAYRIIERVDGQPWLKAPLTPHSGSTHTLSPFVGLP